MISESKTKLSSTSRDAKAAKGAWSEQLPSREHQRQIKEQALYETAARWFNKHGFHGTSLSDLATELGITKAALYHYVSDKSELLYQLHIRSLDAAESARRRGIEEGANGLEKIRLIIRYYVTSITSSQTFTFVLLEDDALTDEQAREILKRRIWLERDLRVLIAEGVKDGSITPCDPKFVALMMGGAMNSVAKWFSSKGTWNGEQVAFELSQMLTRMLSARPAIQLSSDVGSLQLSPSENNK